MEFGIILKQSRSTKFCTKHAPVCFIYIDLLSQSDCLTCNSQKGTGKKNVFTPGTIPQIYGATSITINKFKNVSGFTVTTFNNELMMVFNGFEDQDDLPEFADFVFQKINMKYWDKDKIPTVH